MIEDEATGEKRPVHYDKVRDPATISELKAELKLLNSEIATATGRGAPLVETRARGGAGWGKEFRVLEEQFGKPVADVFRKMRHELKMSDEQIIAEAKKSTNAKLKAFFKDW